MLRRRRRAAGLAWREPLTAESQDSRVLRDVASPPQCMIRSPAAHGAMAQGPSARRAVAISPVPINPVAISSVPIR